MAGKAFAVLVINGQKYPTYASHSGGKTVRKTREVPAANMPNTMFVEPTGGKEFEPLEVTFTERADEGLLLEEVYTGLLEWHSNSVEGKTERRSISIVWYRDAEFTQEMGRHELQQCWPRDISAIEGERESEDPRSFTVTFDHRGSEYKAV
ncbi:MAG TPA: hypothetical protein VNJ87_00155 [Candidatus Macondimonas sp.]|nr:hypothetical protein [Candidatus Macondimonas sp.]